MRLHYFFRTTTAILITLLSVNVFSLMVPTSDAAITAKVKSKIATDKIISNHNIGVKTHNGIVVLTGRLKSKKDLKTLIAIAQETDGVKEVDSSHLIVKQK
jgi:hyperosmotically inducible protein